MDKIEQLFGLFESNNLTGGITIDRFKQATEDERAQLFDLLKRNKLDGGVDYNLFSSAWGEKKNLVPSTSQEVVTESTTTTEAQDGSSDSLEEKTKESYAELLVEKNEELAAEELRDKLLNKGYDVSQTGFGDALSVVNKFTGEDVEIDLQPFTKEGKAEEVAKIESLLSMPEDEKSKALNSLPKELFNDRTTFLEAVKLQFPNFEIQPDENSAGNYIFSKDGVSESINLSKGKFNDTEQLNKVNKFLYNNLTDEDVAGVANYKKLRAENSFDEIQAQTDKIEINDEAIKKDLYGKDYFEDLFDRLEFDNVNIPDGLKDKLKGKDNGPLSWTLGIPRYTKYSADEIEELKDEYFTPEMKAASKAYDAVKSKEVKDGLVEESKKLKVQRYYENLPDREVVRNIVLNENKNLTKEKNKTEIEALTTFKQIEEDSKLLFTSIGERLKELNVDAKAVEAPDGSVIITTDSKDENVINEIKSINLKIKKENDKAKEASIGYNRKLNEVNSSLEDMEEYIDASSRNYNAGEILIQDVKNASVQILGSFGVVAGLGTEKAGELLGSKRMQAIGQAEVKMSREMMAEESEITGTAFETKKSYEQAMEDGSFGFFSLRTFAEQSPNIGLAIATSGLGSAAGLGAKVTETAIATAFGITSAGSKYDELTTRQETAKEVDSQLKDLEKLKNSMDASQYAEIKYNLERTKKDNDISSIDKTLAVFGTGAIEGTVTRFLGSIPNATKFVKNIKKPNKFVEKMLASNYKATRDAFKEIGKSTLGEIGEEVSIDVLTQINDKLFLGDKVDLSSLDDVVLTSIITSGGMNVPGTAYSTIVSQTAINKYKSQIKEANNKIARYKHLLGDNSLTDTQRDLIHQNINNLTSTIANNVSNAEADVLLLGSGRVKELISLGGLRNSLLKRAGVTFDDNYEAANAKTKAYINTLDKAEAKMFVDNIQSIDSSRNEILSSINYEGAVERVFGKKGSDIESTLSSNLTPQEKYNEVYKVIRGEITTEAKKVFEEKPTVDEQDSFNIQTKNGDNINIEVDNSDKSDIPLTDREYGNIIRAKAINDNGKEVGRFTFFEDADGNYYASNAEVNEDNRSQGIASSVYKGLMKKGINIVPAKVQTKEGKQFWENLNKSITKDKVDTKQAVATEQAKDEIDAKQTVAKTYAEELSKIKESNPEAYWSVDEVTEEDAAKGTVIDTEDGSAVVGPDGDIKGVFKKLASKARGVAQVLLKKAVEKGGTKLDNFETGAKGVKLREIYEKNGFRVVARTPFNEAFAPDGWTESDGKPDVVAMVYDPNNELDIEEKTFNDPENGYDQMISYRDSVLDNNTKITTEAQKIKEIMSVDVSSQVENAKEALSKVAPDVEIILHESEQAYAEATGETGRKQKTGGTYEQTVVDGKVKKVIHINPEKANERTVAHEVFHAIFLNNIKSDAEAQRLTAAMIKAVYKTAPADLKKLIDDFATSKNSDGSNNYDLAVQNEEKLAELIGYLAAEYDSLPKPTKNVIKRWLDRLAKMFGLKPFTDSEVIDVLNTIAKKVSTGEAITEQDVAILNGSVSGVINVKSRKQESVLTSFTLKRFPTNPNIKLFEDVPLSDFNEKKSNLLESDRMTGAFIADAQNNPVFKFFGGIYFPQITGKWWASRNLAKANSIAKDMNANRDKDGYVYATPIIMKPNSHMSNQDMFETVWEFMKFDLRSKSNKVTKKLFHKYLNKALTLNSVNLNEADLNIKKSDNVEVMITKLNNVLIGKEVDNPNYDSTNPESIDNPKKIIEESNLSFEKRKAIIKGILGDPKATEDRKFPTAGSISEVASKFEEEKTKKATKLWDIVMLMRTKGTLSAKVTLKSDEFYHKSYPAEISSDQEIEVFFLDGAYNIDTTYPVLTKSSGNTFSWKEYSEKHPSAAFALSQYGRTAKMSKASGDIVAPTTKSSKQQIRIEDIIDKLKSNGISDAGVIKYLEEQGFKNGAKEVTKYNKANDVSIDLFRELPPAFKSTENGLNLAKRVVAHTEKLASRLGIDEAINKGIEFLQSQPEYKKLVKEDNDYILSDALVREFEVMMEKKVKRSPSAEKILGMRAEDKKIRADIRRTLKLRGKGANDLQRLKVQVRNFVKKNIPRGDYTKGEISRILSIVTNVKDINSLDKAMDQVTEFVAEKKSKSLKDYIDKVLSKKYSVTKSGVLVAKTIGAEAKKIIDYINSNKSIDDAYKLIDSIESKDTLTDEDYNQILAAQASIQLLSYDVNDENGLSNLEELKNNLDAIIDEGRSELKAQLRTQHEMYVRNKKDAFKDITGEDYDSMTKEERNKLSFSAEQKKKRDGVIKKAYIKVAESINGFFVKQEAVRGLIDIISKSTGEMFGGKLQEMITDKINDSSFVYKENMIAMKQMLQDKTKEIYGKNYIKSLRNNRKNVDTGYKLSDGNNLFMSQDEAAYLYNQYKDETNHSNFESKFVGEDVADMMRFLENQFISKESKEFSDWMVEELFPSLYGKYNDVYKRMNRIDMPWNSKYGGKLYNVSEKNIEVTDILTGSNNSRASLTNGSQKERVDNNNKIVVMNQMDALFTYLKDMEFYVAYAENLRDIQKIFNDKEIGDAIERTSSKEVLSSLRKKIDNVVNRGSTANQSTARLVNSMTDVFVTSRLGLNPVVGIKQLTSSIAYSSEIGIEKWLSEIPGGVMNFKSTWDEIVTNSPYIRDRYAKSINKTFEVYSEESLSKFIPKSSANKGIDALMWFIKVGDKGGIMGGIPNYIYHKKQFKKKNPNATEQQAIDYAVRKFQNVTKDTQQSNDIQDRDLLQDNPNIRFLQLFQTSQKQYLRKEFSAIRQIARKARGMDSKGSLRSNIETFLMFHTVLPMFFQYIALGLPGILSEWDDDDDDTLARAALVGNLNAIFIFGDAIDAVWDSVEKKPWAGNAASLPVLQSVSAIAKNGVKWSNSTKPETIEKWRDKTLLEAASLTGLPAANISKVYRNLDALINKNETARKKALRFLQFSDYVIEGDKKSSAKKRTTKKRSGSIFGKSVFDKKRSGSIFGKSVFDKKKK